MNLGRRLRRGEEGQVLYMTLVAMLLLAAFTLVLVNVIYMCVLKVKVQNAADNLALSAAVMKARVLNKITNLNAILYVVVQEGGRIPNSPYSNDAEFFAMAAVDALTSGWMQFVVAQYNWNIYHDHYLDRIAAANGIEDATHRVKIFPLEMNALTHFQVNLMQVMYTHNMFYPPPPGLMGPFPFVSSVEPMATPWWVQTRVEWPTRGEAIGFKNLKVKLPDIVARARAEVFDTGLPTPYAHDWQTRLIQPDESYDEQMKNNDWIW
ncbi:MAG: hypothetical protein HGA76_03845 [Candidatus Firestonebacteria bacterium]|nr:hypothetical protein [Candidatus Firestonebacteria bacterium]